MSGCKVNLTIEDREIASAVTLLTDFITDISKFKSKETNINKIVENIIEKLVKNNYVFLSSIDTLLKTNVLTAWDAYRERLEKWLDSFIKNYCFDVYVDELPSDYKARIALEIIILIVKDLIENRFIELPSELRKRLTEEPVIQWLGTPLSLADLVGLLYPTILSLLTSGIISYGTEPIRIASYYSDNIKSLLLKTSDAGKRGGSPYKIYKLIYLPLTSTGLAGEFSIPMLENVGGYKYRFVITGMGHNFVNSMVLVLSQSFNRVYYEHALNNFAGISHAFRIFIQYYLRNILTLDEFSVAKGIIDEYHKFTKGSSSLQYVSYNMSDAVKDIATTTLTLLSQYYHLQALNVPASIVAKYAEFLPAMVVDKPVNEIVKYAVKRLWIYSQL